MNGLETTSLLENTAGGVSSRQSIRIKKPSDASPLAERPVSNIDTQLDQKRVIPNEYTTINRTELTSGSLENTPELSYQRETGGKHRPSARRSPQNRPAIAERFWLLNRWRGQVLKVDGDKFEAQLFDPANPSIIEQAEFSISELAPDSLPFLRAGALFYWMIGYRDLGSRQRRRESIVWIRRSGRMGTEKFNAALQDVERIWKALDESADNAAAEG